MFIADMYQNIKDTEEYPIEDGMVEKLDKMLTDNGVEHFFSLPRIEDTDKDETVALTVAYDSDKDMEFFLVYALWCKVVRGCTDELINKAMLRKIAE